MRILLALLLCFVSTHAFSQTNPVLAGQPFTVVFDHSGENVAGFQCYVDGKPTGATLSASTRRCVIPGQEAGLHTVAVEAINVFGKAKSPDLTATAGGGPEAPSNLRIEMLVAVKSDGTAELVAFHVTKAERVP